MEKTDLNDEFFTITQLSKRYPLFSEGMLRFYRFDNTNNFNSCVRKIGKKIIISHKDFLTWLNTRNASSNK